MVENQSDRKIECLKTNNSDTFGSTKFDSFSKDHRIEILKTTSYGPHKNGVAERMNKTLMERTRSMLSGVGIK